MLNTDAHNPNIKKENKMTLAQFLKYVLLKRLLQSMSFLRSSSSLRMNRGINNGQDMPAEFLEAIYKSITSEAIKMETEVTMFEAEKKGYMVKQGGRIKTYEKPSFHVPFVVVAHYLSLQVEEAMVRAAGQLPLLLQDARGERAHLSPAHVLNRLSS